MTINTDADVIRVIQENPRLLIEAITAHPELRAEVRRAVLTDELLAMPEQLAEMRETQNEMLKTQNEILKSLAETRETQNEMLRVSERDARRAGQCPRRHQGTARDVQATTRRLRQISGQLRD